MRALTRRRYGGPDELRVEEVPDPAPGRGEVLVRVTASALNAADLHLLRGTPRIVRLAMGLRRPRRAVIGRDVSGTVAALGEGVTGFEVGDLVHGEADEGFAELAVVPAAAL